MMGDHRLHWSGCGCHDNDNAEHTHHCTCLGSSVTSILLLTERAEKAEAERNEALGWRDRCAAASKKHREERDRLREALEQVLFACVVCQQRERGEKAIHIRNVDESIHAELKALNEQEVK